MKRIFSVKLASCMLTSSGNTRWSPRTLMLAYETVADNAVEAIRRATRQARREYDYRGGYVVTMVEHRGPAV